MDCESENDRPSSWDLGSILSTKNNIEQIILYKINKIQGYIVQHREYSQYFIITINGI